MINEIEILELERKHRQSVSDSKIEAAKHENRMKTMAATQSIVGAIISMNTSLNAIVMLAEKNKEAE